MLREAYIIKLDILWFGNT